MAASRHMGQEHEDRLRDLARELEALTDARADGTRRASGSFHTWLVDSGLAPGNPTRHLPPVRVPDRRPAPDPGRR